jgi:hypothetical protein
MRVAMENAPHTPFTLVVLYLQRGRFDGAAQQLNTGLARTRALERI